MIPTHDGMVLSEWSRRDFMKVCALAAAALGLPAQAGEAWAKDLEAGRRPSVIWLHLQECTGCTESLLRTSHPDVASLILDMISLDYHETLGAAAGHQAEEALKHAIEANAGKYVLVCEGSVPLKDNGVFCQVGGKTAVALLEECAAKAAAVVAIGSCASWGGLASADPNPTGATGVPMVLKGKTVVTLPGCPANPYNLLGVVLQYASYGTLPKLDAKGRPALAYARTIHEDCPRRPHFDAGRFAERYGDEAHRLGQCLYRLGCKGPATHANCSLLPFNEVPGAWPIGVGHPCYGCTEQELAFRVPLHATIDVTHPTAPATYAPLVAQQGSISPLATGVFGLVGGAILGAGALFAKRLSAVEEEQKKPGKEEQK